MTIEANVEKILDMLEKLAERQAHSDEEGFNIQDYAGGNFDDAYSIGNTDGRIEFARELLEMFNK